MRKLRFIAGIVLMVVFISVLPSARADGTNSVSATPPRPDLLTTCPVSGDAIGSMGAPYVFVYKGQEVKLCCPDCKKDFDKDPEKYMKMIRAADKAQGK
jgi:YHS domain-containing protein